MDKPKIDLNAPAFGEGAQKIEVASVEPVGETEQPNEEEQQVETQVPYSRFKKYHDLAKDAQEEAERWRREAEELRQQPQRTSYSDEAALESWKKMYGDSEASLNYFKLDQARREKALEEMREEALEVVRGERYEEAQRVEANVEIIDENFEQLGDFIGRPITEAEQSTILDAVDYLTPKDRYGNYAGPLVPFEAAWDYVQAKQGKSNAVRSQSRNQVAAASAAQSQGSPDGEEVNKNFNPMDWNAYKKRI